MEVTASAKNIRISPKKVSLLVDQIRKMGPAQALSILEFTPKASSAPLIKVIKSALANAKNNFGIDENSLTFKTILVEKGQVFKRFRAVSRGRAHAILKRTSHIKVTLEQSEKKENKVQTVAKKTETKMIEKPKETKEGSNSGSKS